MKKVLLAIFSIAIIAQSGLCATTTAQPTTADILKDLKNAVISDVTNSVTTNVNNIKLATYKTQLEQKKQELKEVEKSSSPAIIKYFKRARINSKIAELEANIKLIEDEQKSSK